MKLEKALEKDYFLRNYKGWLMSPGTEPDPYRGNGRNLGIVCNPDRRWWWSPEVEATQEVALTAIFDRQGGEPNEAGVGPGRTRSYLNDLEMAEISLRMHRDFHELGLRVRAYATPILDMLDDEFDVPTWLEAAWSVVPFIDALDLPEPTNAGDGRPRAVLHERVVPALHQIETLADDPLEATTVMASALHRLRYCVQDSWRRVKPVEDHDLLDVFTMDD
jgi:hypothetical protein